MIYETLDGVKLAYRDIGDGTDPFTLIHGWACEHSFLMSQLKHLSQYYPVLAIDLCRHGASDVPDREYMLAEFADDIRWLSTTLNLPPAVIVGHSRGGAVAPRTGRFAS